MERGTMAETATAQAEKPARSRTRSTAKAPAAEAAAVADRVVLELLPVGNTKTYSKWQAPDGSGCAGNFYAPLGVTSVKVAYTKA
jgi:hypothetical protein